MPDEPYRDDDDLEIYEDFEEHVDFDEHEQAQKVQRTAFRSASEETDEADHYDEYHYGEDSGEAYEDEDLP